MKNRLIVIWALLVAVFACTPEYELDTTFTMPTELDSPAAVTLDVTSSETVTLSWTGGYANDGGILLYNVLFDKEGGDFSSPVASLPSDLGAGSQLTLTHAQLNTIAKDAGIKSNSTGNVIWTVTGSKGGVTKMFDGFETITLTRGDVIDAIPEKLFINGAAAREAGQEFRATEKGIFVIFTRLDAGKVRFTSEKTGGTGYYVDATGRLSQGEGDYSIDAAPESGLARVTVNFNTLNVKVEEIGTSVRLAWGLTYNDPATDAAVLEYAGNGEFKGTGEVTFSEQSWGVEERYYFLAKVNGAEVCWGSNVGGAAITPDGTEEYWYIYEHAVNQWDNLWKMDHSMNQSNVAFTIYTNKDNKWTHGYEKAGDIVYEQPSSAPAELYITGTAAEQDGAAFRKASDGVFVLYQKLNAGTLSFRSGDAEPVRYFTDADNKLYIGPKNAEISASEDVTRITVDFNTNTVTYDQVSDEVRLILAWTEEVYMILSYQGNGKYSGEGEIKFVNPGWQEERYHFRTTVNGSEVVWGRVPEFNDGNNRPDGDNVAASMFYIGEYPYRSKAEDQFTNLWKFASNLENSTAVCTINTNDNGAFTHSFSKTSLDPAPPAIIPSELALHGSGAEVDGQPFRKAGNGVFEIFAKLNDGKISFRSADKNYFLSEENTLLQGAGETVSTSSGENVTRITVNFNDQTVTYAQVSKVRCIFIVNFVDIMQMTYAGAGKWEGEGIVNFVPANTVPGITWMEERYYFIPTIDGTESRCWGRKDGVTEQQPDGSADFYDIVEFGWEQWYHAWKFASEMNGANVHILLDTNRNGVMTHVVTKK